MSTPNPKQLADRQLIDDFNRRFNKSLSSADQVLYLVSLSPEVREWYTERKKALAAEKSLPGHLAEVGFTPEEWRECQAYLSIARDASRKHADTVSTAARVFDAAIAAADALRARALSDISPLAQIAAVSVAQLPFEAHLRLALLTPDERKAASEEEVKSFRRRLLDQYRANPAGFESPFRK